ncbi:MAG: hypothetical protein ACPG4T_05090 [Nannocystaceae bacterium]
MLFIISHQLPKSAAKKLQLWQREVDALADYASRVAEGKRLFQSRNQTKNRTFVEVRSTLEKMCHGARRCGYCEDSYADEVEHIKPKDLYPEVVFCWENYLYVCGPCNGPKGNQFAVFPKGAGQKTIVSRRPDAPVDPPVKGSPVFLDPRAENPLDYIILDLCGTFFFLPQAEKGTREYERADFTINTLRLNKREALVKARENAYSSYRARLREYCLDKKKGASQEKLDSRMRDLQASPHPTVWHEMKRQRDLHSELAELFAQVPEAVGW